MRRITVRLALPGEEVTTLDGVTRAVTPHNMLIADSVSGALMGIAGIKGGQYGSISERTKTIFIESANFDPVNIRKSSQAMRLHTDASKRFENDLAPFIAEKAVQEAARLIKEVAGGALDGYVDVYPERPAPRELEITTPVLNQILGTSLASSGVSALLQKLDFKFEFRDTDGGAFTVSIPEERLDVRVREDLAARW